MEQSSAQNQMPGLPHAGAPQGVPSADYWLDALYPDPQLQSQAPPPSQQQNPSVQQQQVPMGITWDHPVFQQQQERAQQQQNPLTPQSDPNHGIYSSIPPSSWQSNPLQNAARYGSPSQYQPHQQAMQYQQGQITFDPGSLDPSDSSAFPSYPSYQSGYFHPQQIPMQDSFPPRTVQPQHQQQQQQQPTEYPASTPQSSIQYSMPSGYTQDLLSNTIDLTNDDFVNAESGVSHQTIDPSFLNGITRSSNSSQPLANNYSFAGPVDYERSDGLFNYFQNDISIQPQVVIHVKSASTQSGTDTFYLHSSSICD